MFSPARIILYACVLVTAAGAVNLFSAHAADAQAPPVVFQPLAIEGDAARGAVIGETCKGCHLVPGAHNAYPAYHVPKLGGQNADYVEVALQGYRAGQRDHGTMQAQASTLTDQDIADLAAYFAGIEGAAESVSSKAALVAAGEKRAEVCATCHGQGGQGVANSPQWPKLAGQHASYIEQALEQYKSGERADVLMSPMAAPLDDAAIEELAAYFAAQPWLHSPER